MRNTLGCESWFLLLDRENQWQVISCIVNYNLQCSAVNKDLWILIWQWNYQLLPITAQVKIMTLFFLFYRYALMKFLQTTRNKTKKRVVQRGRHTLLCYKLVFELSEQIRAYYYTLCLRPHKKGQWALHVYSIKGFVASWLKCLQMSLYVSKKSTEVIWIHLILSGVI